MWPNVIASTPTPVGDTVSAIEAGFDAGTARDPDQSDLHFQMTPHPVSQQGSFYPFQIPLGHVSRPTMHPSGPVGTLHDSGWNFQGGSAGIHGELVLQAATPDGSQQPWGIAPKTFRAPPVPWDQDAYVGWQPLDPED